MSISETYALTSSKYVKKKPSASTRVCGCKPGIAISISLLEIGVSIAGLCCATVSILSWPEHDSNIFRLHDEMYMEAQKHFPKHAATGLPLSLLYFDSTFFFMELVLAFLLFIGIVKSNTRYVGIWLTCMVAYTTIVTGIILGFLIGGVRSSYLNIMAFIHAIFRFTEITVIYSLYETLKEEDRQQRLFLSNNNLNDLENVEAQLHPRAPNNEDLIAISTIPLIY